MACGKLKIIDLLRQFVLRHTDFSLNRDATSIIYNIAVAFFSIVNCSTQSKINTRVNFTLRGAMSFVWIIKVYAETMSVKIRKNQVEKNRMLNLRVIRISNMIHHVQLLFSIFSLFLSLPFLNPLELHSSVACALNESCFHCFAPFFMCVSFDCIGTGNLSESKDERQTMKLIEMPTIT